MYNRVTEKTQNGSIILFHNGVENTPEALDKTLTKLEKDGYEFVTVSELIYWDNYEIDHTGRQYQLLVNFTNSRRGQARLTRLVYPYLWAGQATAPTMILSVFKTPINR